MLDAGNLDLYTGPMQLSEGVISMIEDSPYGVLWKTPMMIRSPFPQQSDMKLLPPRLVGSPQKLAKVLYTKRAPSDDAMKPGAWVHGEFPREEGDNDLAVPLVVLEEEMTHL